MDEILVKNTLSGDKAAFNQLVARYQTQVYGLAFNISRNFSDAEDLAQEAFLRAYLSLHQLRELSRHADVAHPMKLKVYHTGFEPASVGFYRAVVAVLSATEEFGGGWARDLGAWLTVLPLYYRGAGDFKPGLGFGQQETMTESFEWY